MDLVTPLKELAAITSEKGKPSNAKITWQNGSLFRLIDDAIVKRAGHASIFGAPFPAVVCDDLASEVGDFLGADNTPASLRIAAIAAKYKDGDPGVSASAFYDISGQGIKNLAYLKSDGIPLPGSADKFDKDWKLSTKKGQFPKKTDLIPRKRAGPGSGEFRKMFTQIKSSPNATRALWLVCAGGMLSKAKLEHEFRQKPPEAHVLQFYHLVVSAYSACQSVGVDLRIFSAE